MMPAPNFVQPVTPISTVSSSGAAHTTTAIQSGPYTKAQFLNTMDGSRSVKNIKEIEQLLRDYPAALELYRTKRYKVKVKYEADVERVILVEKRSSRNSSNNNVPKTTDKQSNHDISPDATKTQENIRQRRDSDRSRSRTHSRDRVLPTTSVSENNDIVQPTASSIRMTSNAQPKVDHQRTPSKEHVASEASQSQQEQQQQQSEEQQQQQPQQHTHHRGRSHDSRSNTSRSRKGKRNSRDYPTALVPYIPNGHPAANMWQQSRALQPYYHNPLFQQHPHQANMYMPSAYMGQQNPMYQQPYYYSQQHPYSYAYQQQAAYPSAPQIKSAGNINRNHNPTHRSAHNYQATSRTMYNPNPNPNPNLPPSFHTFHSNQQAYPTPQTTPYSSQMPFQMPVSWPAATNKPVDPVENTNIQNTPMSSRRGSKHRAHSVDTGPRGHAPMNYYNQQSQQQSAATIIEHHHHHHRHHHYRPQPTGAPIHHTTSAIEPIKDLNSGPMTEQTAGAAANSDNNGEKLTIRQLNDIFIHMDPSGRLPYSSVPPVLQRFGMSLGENDLTSAAQELKYNVAEPISARRLVHVLVKLGKIAKSTHPQKPPQMQQQQQQPQSLVSPAMLPEDREVTDIMTQRRTTGAASTHIHSSVYPNHWY